METFTLVKATVQYWTRVLPYARQEITRWEQQARTFADPVLRQTAQAKIIGERRNLESAAFFALLARDEWHPAVNRIIVFQAVYELLDGLNEIYPTLDDGRRLHGTLDGILCGSSSTLRREVRRVGEAQARNHAREGLRAWAGAFVPNMLWWEAAGAGISSLGVLAMLATPPSDHDRIAEAYRPVDALASLLDALVDLPADRQTGNHNWLDHYDSERQMANRVVFLTRDALGRLASLRDASIHRMILAGLLAHNLAATQDHAPWVEKALKATFPLVRVGLLGLNVQHVVLRSSTHCKFGRISHRFR